ncbi:GNAT family N-acetyltransferase [Arthrobacter pigmenti]
MSVSPLHHEYEKSRFDLYENGELAGYVQYSTGCHALSLRHTYIVPGHRGRGLAFLLIRRVLDEMRRRRVSIQPERPIVAEFLRTHRQYRDLLAAPGARNSHLHVVP